MRTPAELPIGDDENVVRAREAGFPWCDTCRRPAVFREGEGMLHSTPEHRFGLPRRFDDSGHEVTIHEWDAAVTAWWAERIERSES